MANRVSSAEVKQLTGSGLGDAVVDAFISPANTIVTRELSNEGFTDKELKQIELFLAAHLLTANRERQATSERVDPASIRYSDIFDKGIDSTTYGQTVTTLDSTGKIARSFKKSITVKAVVEEHEFRYLDNPNV